MTTLLLHVAMVALLQIFSTVAAAPLPFASFNLTRSSLIVKPTATLSNTTGYDYANNGKRFTALVVAKAKADASAKAASKKWAVASAKTTLASGKAVVVRAKTTLVLNNTGDVGTRSRGSATFAASTTLSLSGFGLSLTNYLLDFTRPSTTLSATAGFLILTNGQLRGTLSSFTTNLTTVKFIRSNVHLVNTPVQISSTKLLVTDSSVDIKRSKPTVAAAPAYAGAAPFLVHKSFVSLQGTTLRLVNVTDAFFVQSTLNGSAFVIELVNSNVRFIDSVLSYNLATFKLTNSTLQLLNSKPTKKQYLLSVTGALTGVPKPVPSKPRKALTLVLNNAHVKGTGALVFVDTP